MSMFSQADLFYLIRAWEQINNPNLTLGQLGSISGTLNNFTNIGYFVQDGRTTTSESREFARKLYLKMQIDQKVVISPSDNDLDNVIPLSLQKRMASEHKYLQDLGIDEIFYVEFPANNGSKIFYGNQAMDFTLDRIFSSATQEIKPLSQSDKYILFEKLEQRLADKSKTIVPINENGSLKTSINIKKINDLVDEIVRIVDESEKLTQAQIVFLPIYLLTR